MKKQVSVQKYPVVALVGRPNVGKSSLFNALLKERRAVVFDEPGTTRDPVTALAGKDYPYFLVDTAGLEVDSKIDLDKNIREQTKLAIGGADLVVFLVDAKQGPTYADRDVVEMLRKARVPYVFVANKAEGKVDLLQFAEFGLGVPEGISALERMGVEELEEEFLGLLKKEGKLFRRIKEEDKKLKLVFVGRPNVGKSSLVNAFLRSPRCIVSDVPGTTRDTTELPFEFEGKEFVLLDTAGLRRHARRESMIENFATMRTLESLYRANVAFLLVNAEDGPTTQDARIAEELVRAGVGVVLVVNKVDLLDDLESDRRRLEDELRYQFKFLAWAPVIFISAKTKKNILVCLQLAEEIMGRVKQKIDQEELQHAFLAAITKRPHPSFRGKLVKFYGIGQLEDARAAVFVIRTNRPEEIHFSYRRYLINQLRERFDLTGVPVKLKLEDVKLIDQQK